MTKKMKIEREKAVQIKTLIDAYNGRISEYEKDVAKIAELRAVRTLRDGGAVQVLQILDVDGLTVKPVHVVEFDVDRASNGGEA